MVNIYGLYSTKDPEKIRYIGKTKKSIEGRFKEHLFNCKNQKSFRVYKWMRKQYRLGFEVKTVLIDTCEEINWESFEIGYIALFKACGAQLTNGTNGGKYTKYSEYSKKLIGNAHRGKKLTKEQKENISKAQKGKILSKEHKNTISKSLKNKKKSEQHSLNIAKSLGFPVEVFDLDGNLLNTYHSINEAEKQLFLKEKRLRQLFNSAKTKKVYTKLPYNFRCKEIFVESIKNKPKNNNLSYNGVTLKVVNINTKEEKIFKSIKLLIRSNFVSISYSHLLRKLNNKQQIIHKHFKIIKL